MKKTSLPLLVLSYFFLLFLQGLFLEILWMHLTLPKGMVSLGWKLGLLYGLFCLFLSGSRLLSLLLEEPHEFARDIGAFPMKEREEPASRLCCSLLEEILQLREGEKPELFLIPSDELNAFSFQIEKRGALFFTRGALHLLSRSELKVLLTRQLLELRHPFLKRKIFFVSSLPGLCPLFFAGATILQKSSFGRFEGKKADETKHPFYFIGLFPLLLGLPSWWLARLFLLWLDPKDSFLLDAEVSKGQENAREMACILKKIQKHPLDAMAPSLWPMRAIALHHQGFLENLLPVQPSLERRLEHLAALEVAPFSTQRTIQNRLPLP